MIKPEPEVGAICIRKNNVDSRQYTIKSIDDKNVVVERTEGEQEMRTIMPRRWFDEQWTELR